VVMGRVVQGLRAWYNSLICPISFFIHNSTRGVLLFFVISFLGFFATVGIGSVVSNRYAVLVAFMVMFIITIIAFFTVFIDGLRSLADALPMLVEELRGRAPPGDTEVPLCLVEYFGGRATEVLSKLYTLSLIITLIVMYYLIIMSGGLASSLMTGPSLSLNETMRTTSLFTEEVPTAFRTTVDITLGILGVVITVAFSLGSLLIGRGVVDAETLRVVHGVRFRSLTWFSIAITLIIVSVMLPPIASIVLIAPITLAITISLVTYLTLATTVIEHMQSPRGRPRRRSVRLRGPWG